MIIRIVKLIIDREKVDEFQLFFEKAKPSIGNFIGCSHVELLKETKRENVYFTYSHWKNEDMLQNYRNSIFFQGIWKNTKTYLSGKPEAWSLNKIDL